MLTAEENELFTQVGPGTPMGRLMRWYWHPIAAATQLDENPVKAVRVLGEDLVLFRDRSGNLALIEGRCAHRRVELRFGIPEKEGLRCAYHGWLYSPTGQCLQMPDEAVDSTFPSRVKLQTYPVRELAGVIFAYLGPDPSPLLPNWDLFAMENVGRDVGFQVLNCNWLQVQENDMDPAHLEWLHGYFSNYALERMGRKDLQRPPRNADGVRTPVGERRDWAVYEQGVMNYAKTPNGLREVRPSIFPNVNSFTTDFMYRVPMDDTHTLHVFFTSYAQDPTEGSAGEGALLHRSVVRGHAGQPYLGGVGQQRRSGRHGMGRTGADRRPHQGAARRVRPGRPDVPRAAATADSHRRGRRRAHERLPRRRQRTCASPCRLAMAHPSRGRARASTS